MAAFPDVVAVGTRLKEGAHWSSVSIMSNHFVPREPGSLETVGVDTQECKFLV